jgi:hypothetical protein
MGEYFIITQDSQHKYCCNAYILTLLQDVASIFIQYTLVEMQYLKC